VLVVDDALTIRELQRTILERAGYRVRLASDGMEALALLADDPCDLVLTDVEMPRMDGFALTEAIRAYPTLSNLPVLVLTSKSTDVDRQRGLEAGADGYIVKRAFDEQGLLAAIERLLAAGDEGMWQRSQRPRGRRRGLSRPAGARGRRLGSRGRHLGRGASDDRHRCRRAGGPDPP
jgi:CheY-like chemotaxis protein